jgi:Predicted membrane protein (DUF2127)
MSTQRQPHTALNMHSGDASAGGPLSGWATFAGTMLGMVAMLNVIYGVGAINNANFYIHDARYVISGLNTWGWILLIGGAIQFCAAIALFAGRSWGRWLAVVVASLNAVGQLLFLPSAPWLSVTLFAVDVAIIYGLIARWDAEPVSG